VNENIIISVLTLGGIAYLLMSPSIDLSFIKRFEGLRLKPYKDSGGKWTIGYGHLIKIPSENYLLNKNGITNAKAENLLRQDVKIAENSVKINTKIPLNKNQLNALVSLVFNIGIGNFSRSTMLKLINQNKITQAAGEFPKWRFINGKESPGLLLRRAKEQSMFMS